MLGEGLSAPGAGILKTLPGYLNKDGRAKQEKFMLKKRKFGILVVLAMIFAMVFGACGEAGDLLGDFLGNPDNPGVNPAGQESNPDYPDGAEPGPDFFEVGDITPRNGIIFYVADGKEGRPLGFTVQGYGNPGDPGYFASYTAYYLEAAPEDLPGTYTWGGTYELFTELDEQIKSPLFGIVGHGRSQTAFLHHFSNEGHNAATPCITHNIGDRTDWFLPSNAELNILFQQWSNTGKPAYYKFAEDIYWSSTYYGYDERVYLRRFDDSGDHPDGDYYSNTICKVRPIRAF